MKQKELDKSYIKKYGGIDDKETKGNVTAEKTDIIFKNLISPFLDRMIKKWSLKN